MTVKKINPKNAVTVDQRDLAALYNELDKYRATKSDKTMVMVSGG